MDGVAVGGVIGIIISLAVLVLAIAAIIMPLVVLAINSKLNRIIKILQSIENKP